MNPNSLIPTAALALLQIGGWQGAIAQTAEEVLETLSKLEGHAQVAEFFTDRVESAPPEVRRKYLDALVQIANEEAIRPLSERRIGITNVANSLINLGDEPSIMAAFRNNFDRWAYFEQIDAGAALAQCKDPAAILILEQAARVRLADVPDSMPENPDDEERIRFNHRWGWFAQLVELMAQSPNPAGRVAAKQLRDELARQIEGAPFKKFLLDHLDTEYSLGEAPKQGTNSSEAAPPAPAPESRLVTDGAQADSTSTAPIVIWALGAVGLLGLTTVVVILYRKGKRVQN